LDIILDKFERILLEKRSSLKIFLSVIRALFLRELEMRFSQGKSGLFWAFFEPFLQIFILISIRVAIAHARGTSANATNFDYAVFMASGFIAFNMFKHILSKSTGAFTANKGLFVYKQVKPIDTIIARVLIELFLTTLIMSIFLFIGFIFDYDNTIPKNILMVGLGYLWVVIFSFSIGLVIGIGNTFFMSIGKFISIISFALLIFSAIFYPIISLPPAAQEMLLYNPLVHFMEMIHGFWLDELDTQFVDYLYMLEWTLVPLLIGIWLYYRLEKRIISQ
jgi:capsular polysaccharide transport system permease protein